MSTVVIPISQNFVLINSLVTISDTTEYLYQNTGQYLLQLVVASALPVVGQTGLQLRSNDIIKFVTAQNIYVACGSELGAGFLTVFDTELVPEIDNGLLSNDVESPLLGNDGVPLEGNF